ncbi:hypothetical protein X943_001446 [Babesia divergens]|uniref:CPW-WPC domain-containing protein n=1 Tax=Babesia divergens TaxID=32595 RepID=A0AAD9LEL1_BABDI|nr:hypothetical protein X943_001446 [Babesia divergens]
MGFYRALLPFYLILFWCVGVLFATEPDHGIDGEPSSPAEAISKDVSGLSEQLDEVAEEGEWKDETLGPEEAHAKKQEAFEGLYQHALDQGLEDGKAAYKAYEHSAVEELDLVGLASEHLKRFWYTGQCRRQYWLQCPNGWSWNDDAKQCIAPQDYIGPCDIRKDFTHMNRDAREEYAWRCHVSWPCVNDLPIDKDMLCPLEWIKVSNSICLAPPGYSGVCPPISDFGGMTALDKAVYEHMCDVKWPRVVTMTPKWPTLMTTSSLLGSDQGLSGAINEAGVMVPM